MVYKKYEDVYCLFHEKKNCICFSPVTDTETLRKRLETCIEVNEGLYDIELDFEKLIEIERRIAGFQKRIDDLEIKNNVENKE